MRRTFTVTIECADEDNIDRTRVHLALDNAFTIPSDYITVTETTATHAKEQFEACREMLARTVGDMFITDSVEARAVVIAAMRLIRALPTPTTKGDA